MTGKEKTGLTVEDQLWMAKRFGLDVSLEDESSVTKGAEEFVVIMRTMLTEPCNIKGELLDMGKLAAEMVDSEIGLGLVDERFTETDEQVSSLTVELVKMFHKDFMLETLRK